jgi:hypothetical protein
MASHIERRNFQPRSVARSRGRSRHARSRPPNRWSGFLVAHPPPSDLRGARRLERTPITQWPGVTTNTRGRMRKAPQRRPQASSVLFPPGRRTSRQVSGSRETTADSRRRRRSKHQICGSWARANRYASSLVARANLQPCSAAPRRGCCERNIRAVNKDVCKITFVLPQARLSRCRGYRTSHVGRRSTFARPS